MRNFLIQKPVVRFISSFISTYAKTVRFTLHNEDKWKSLVDNEGRPVLVCLFHQHIFFGSLFCSKYHEYQPSVMVSKSRDGELGARILQEKGWYTVRGSSSRGGAPAMKEMTQRLQQYKFGAHILDGPKGPAGVVKPGALRIAELSGALIVPFWAEAENCWYFNSWDRMLLPKPFSRVKMFYGDPVDIPRPLTGRRFEELRVHIEQMILPHLKHIPVSWERKVHAYSQDHGKRPA